MTRSFSLRLAAAVACVAAVAAPAAAQLRMGPKGGAPVVRACAAGCEAGAAAAPADALRADVHGIVLDDAGQPLAGVVISALGATTAFAVSDPQGRFALRNLPYGPYLVRAHLQGYVPARGRIVQVNTASHALSTIALTRRPDRDRPVAVLTAGVGPGDVEIDAAEPIEDGPQPHDHGEVAWRLRHLKRSVLKEAVPDLIDVAATSLRDIESPGGFASSLLAGLPPLYGQVNLLTTTSFHRPQDLFSSETWLPRGIAFVALQAPTGAGQWTMQGAITEGDLASWTLAGSYVRRASVPHRYEAGLSYGMQRYRGGNADALAAVSDGARNVGAVYAYDDWRIAPRVSVSYGAKYTRYDYLARQGLLSPRASLTVAPTGSEHLKVRASVSRRAIAPGAEEFIPPSTGLLLPPERTFSPVSSRSGFTPEHVDHVELSAERTWVGAFVIGVRAFHQRVDDQLVTLFGVALPGTAAANLGHYYVATGGDLRVRGWGVSVGREMADGLRASIDYTQADSAWVRRSPDAGTLALVGASVLRDGEERIHDLTTSIESVLPVTDTRVFVVYKVNTGFAAAAAPVPQAAARFDVQLNQSLPFLNFTSAQWEMLVAVRNLFRDELLEASIYDELLVVRPPKRIVGGVTVRF